MWIAEEGISPDSVEKWQNLPEIDDTTCDVCYTDPKKKSPRPPPFPTRKGVNNLSGSQRALLANSACLGPILAPKIILGYPEVIQKWLQSVSTYECDAIRRNGVPQLFVTPSLRILVLLA